MSGRTSWVDIANRSKELEAEMSSLGREEIVEQVKALLDAAARTGASTWSSSERRVLSDTRAVWATRLRLMTDGLIVPPMIESFRGRPPGKLRKVEPAELIETLRIDGHASYVKVKKVDFTEVPLDQLDIRNSRFEDCSIGSQAVKGAQLQGTSFVRCDLTGSVFDRSRFEHSNFQGCTLDRAHFNDCDFTLARFTGPRQSDPLPLAKTMFDDCSMREVKFHKLQADRVSFSSCNLRRAIFVGARGTINFEGGDLSDADFSASNLNVGLENVNLEGVDLKGFDLGDEAVETGDRSELPENVLSIEAHRDVG